MNAYDIAREWKKMDDYTVAVQCGRVCDRCSGEHEDPCWLTRERKAARHRALYLASLLASMEAHEDYDGALTVPLQ